MRVRVSLDVQRSSKTTGSISVQAKEGVPRRRPCVFNLINEFETAFVGFLLVLSYSTPPHLEKHINTCCC